jgi:hypothetical protein
VNDQKRAEMAALVDTFDEQYRRGLMPVDLYARSMVVCSHEYIELGEMALGTALLRRCPSNYFATAFVKQMEDDKRFEMLAYEVATALDAAGLVKELAASGISFSQPGLGRA